MNALLKHIALGLCLMLGSTCTANRFDDYRELREEEFQDATTCEAKVRELKKCLWAIDHYKTMLKKSSATLPMTVSYTTEELKGFIAIETNFFRQYVQLWNIPLTQECPF